MINVVEITDINAPELETYNRLSEAQLLHYFEPKEGVFVAESPLVIERALNAGYEPLSLLVEDAKLNKELINKCGVTVFTAHMDILKQITGFKLTRGALCLMRRKALPTVEEICRSATRIAVLEDVVNPTNVGAIMRSAAALNMDAVLLTKPCSDPLYRRAARVSMGTVFQVPWTYFPDEEFRKAEEQKPLGKQSQTEKEAEVEEKNQPGKEQSYVEYLKKQGFATAAMALTDQSVSIDNPSLMQEEKLAIILGTEGEGLKPETIAACDYTVKIPMSHGVDSLNVAAASAVAFWQLGKK